MQTIPVQIVVYRVLHISLNSRKMLDGKSFSEFFSCLIEVNFRISNWALNGLDMTSVFKSCNYHALFSYKSGTLEDIMEILKITYSFERDMGTVLLTQRLCRITTQVLAFCIVVINSDRCRIVTICKKVQRTQSLISFSWIREIILCWRRWRI